MRTRLFSAVLLLSLGASSPLLAQPPATKPAPTTSAPRSDRTLVYVLTTGLEDAQVMQSVFVHARVAAEQRRLREVVILVYGRGVFAFDGDIEARPPKLAESIRQAMKAGVKIQVCGTALAHMGIDRKRLDPTPTEIVPQATVTLVDYVAGGAAVVKY
ncbi:MAG: DsrE family protein [Kofleriaceae bacterium]|nr:DsrE family protein [Kofleriaceae bacterium]